MDKARGEYSCMEFGRTGFGIKVRDMIFRAFTLFTGFGIAVSGGVSTIAYLNLLTTGHGFTEYLAFISTRIECYLLPIGLIIMWLSLYTPGNRY